MGYCCVSPQLTSCKAGICRARICLLPTSEVEFGPAGNQPEPCALLLLPWHRQPAKINVVPWGSTENGSPCAVWKHEAALRYETQKILAGTTASLSTELSIHWCSPLVFAMVGFPASAYLDNPDAPCLFGLRIFKWYNVKGKSKSQSKQPL